MTIHPHHRPVRFQQQERGPHPAVADAIPVVVTAEPVELLVPRQPQDTAQVRGHSLQPAVSGQRLNEFVDPEVLFVIRVEVTRGGKTLQSPVPRLELSQTRRRAALYRLPGTQPAITANSSPSSSMLSDRTTRPRRGTSSTRPSRSSTFSASRRGVRLMPNKRHRPASSITSPGRSNPS